MQKTRSSIVASLVAGCTIAAVNLSPASAETTVVAKPPPYSLAWQLRPVAPGNGVRSDTAVAMFDGANDTSGLTVASTLGLSYKVMPTLAPLVRFAVVSSSPPTGEGAVALSNPLVGVIWAPPVVAAPFKLGVFGGVTIPVGSGGGNDPDPVAKAAIGAGVAARSAMDNALFAINDTALSAGVDFAYVKGGLTVQAEATLLQAFRVRGDEVQPDKTKTNLTSGIHAGYFVMPWLSIGGELRYQRYLSTPSFVMTTPALRDNLTAAAGVRGHIDLGNKRWLRPGIAYARGLDDPMTGSSFDIVQVDVPFAF